MVQQLLLALLFAGSLVYLGRSMYRSFQSKSSGCSTGCGKCGAVDFQKIEAQIRSKNS